MRRDNGFVVIVIIVLVLVPFLAVALTGCEGQLYDHRYTVVQYDESGEIAHKWEGTYHVHFKDGDSTRLTFRDANGDFHTISGRWSMEIELPEKTKKEEIK